MMERMARQRFSAAIHCLKNYGHPDLPMQSLKDIGCAVGDGPETVRDQALATALLELFDAIEELRLELKK